MSPITRMIARLLRAHLRIRICPDRLGSGATHVQLFFCDEEISTAPLPKSLFDSPKPLWNDSDVPF